MEKILDLQNQSSLAKLLATENITVTHSKSLSTAYFDVKNRVLGLPVWKDKGKVVYDMLVGHEVSHALYTDHAEFEKFIAVEGRGNFDILNIIEDIRIERLIKLKYAGMPRIFNGAYKELVEADFFDTANKDITALSFLDRLNLRAKVGPFIDVPLNPIEEDIYNRCLQAETFDDVVKLYHEVKKFMNDQKKEEQSQDDEQSTEEEQSKGDSDETSEDTPMNESPNEWADFFDTSDDFGADNVEDDGEESFTQEVDDALEDDGSTEETETVRSNQEPDSAAPSASEGASGKSDSNGEDIDLTNQSETMKSFDENAIEEQETDMYGRNRTPAICLWPTKTTVEKHIIPYKTVLSRRSNTSGDPESYDKKYLELVATRSIEFKKNLNKKVGVLVREFERRKASYQYSRAQESRRGSLDVNNLHKYKYDDQIFQTTMKLADAKSHGMIFFIDYSGSMSHVLRDVLEHTLNLVHFCKKVGIPFEVYSFTSNYSLDDSDVGQSEYEFDMKDLVLANLFSSNMSKAEYKIAFDQVVNQISFSNAGRFSQHGLSPFEHLGGTPLNAALMAAHHVVKKFNKKHSVQKTNVIFLTDGESHSCFPANVRYCAPSFMTIVGGKQYSLPRTATTPVLTKMLGDITGATTIGWYLPSCKSAAVKHLRGMAFSSAKELHYSDTTKKWIKQYNKDGFFNALNCFGYDSYFLLNSDIKIKDEEFAYKPNTDKSLSDSRGEQSKLAREFAKHNVKNRQNRIIMTKFAETIA
jgi:hypothetical protein